MTAQTEPQALPETGEDEDDADRRAKGVMAHHLEYGPLAMQRTIAKAIRSAVEAEREACAQVAFNLWKAGLADLTSGQMCSAIGTAIRARGPGS